jgi:hypothetical protein
VGGNAAAVFENFWGVRVLLGGHMAGLFQQRQIHKCCRVALGAGVTIPVPGTAKITTLFDDAHVADAGFFEPCAGKESSETSTDEGDGDLVREGIAGNGHRMGIVEILREKPGSFYVLLVAITTQALISLGQIFGADPFEVLSVCGRSGG